MDCSTPGFPVPLYLPEFAKFMSTETMMLSNHLILCTFLSFCLQSFPESGSFPMSWVCIRWPKYQRFSISPSSEYSRLVSFRNDWFDFLAVEGTLKSLLQHHHFESINSSALSFLYGPALTSLHDHWKNHSFEYRDLWWQSDVSAF